MEFKRRFVFWVLRLFTYWGLLKHPYGREYAKERYTPLGGHADGVQRYYHSGGSASTDRNGENRH